MPSSREETVVSLRSRHSVTMAQFGRLLVTRSRGKDAAKTLPLGEDLTLDFKDVEVVSPSFLDEILRWLIANNVKRVRFTNTSDNTNRSIQRLIQILEKQTPNQSPPQVELVG